MYVDRTSKSLDATKDMADRMADTWTIKAIGQDDFSDVPMPDAPAQPAHTPNASAVKSAGKA